MKLLIIDNYDSFTYNLKHYAEQFCNNVTVKRNNEIELEEISEYDAIIISPGPGLPKDAGITMAAIERYYTTKKILGVCLGQQAIAEFFGARLANLENPLHGVAIKTFKAGEDSLFSNIPKEFNTGRYHSWIAEKDSLKGTDLEIIAIDELDQVQAIRHKKFNIRAMQFHPESVMTDYGLKMIENWVINC